MRVALLSTSQDADDSPGQQLRRRAQAFGRALAAKGHEVHLFESIHARSSGYSKNNGLHYHTVSVTGRNGKQPASVQQSMLYYLRSTQGVAGPFDIMHCFQISLVPVAAEMSSWGPVPTFLSIESEDDASLSSLLLASQRGWNLHEAVDRVLVSSPALKEILRARFGLDDSKVVVLGNGVDLEKYGKWVDQGKIKQRYHMGPLDPMILFVGELYTGCGADQLLEALFALVREFNALKVVFAGDGPMLPYLRERARVLGIEHACRFLAFLPEEHLADLYNATDFVLVPCDHRHADEILLEAWCAGKPTLVSPDVLPEFVETSRDALVIDIVASSISDALRRMLMDPSQAKAMGACAWRKVSAEHSWNAIAEKTLHLYSNVTPRRIVS